MECNLNLENLTYPTLQCLEGSSKPQRQEEKASYGRFHATKERNENDGAVIITALQVLHDACMLCGGESDGAVIFITLHPRVH